MSVCGNSVNHNKGEHWPCVSLGVDVPGVLCGAFWVVGWGGRVDAMDLCGLSMTALHRPAFVTGNVT